jgi:hypothetical protein
MSGKKLTAAEVISGMNTAAAQLKTLLQEMFPLIPVARECACRDSMREAKV